MSGQMNDKQTETFREELVGAIRFVGCALDRLGLADASTPLGAVEAHSLKNFEGLETIAKAIEGHSSENAEAIKALATSIDGLTEAFTEGFSSLSASIFRGLAGRDGFAVSNCISAGCADVSGAISELAKAVNADGVSR
jgi:hypothetical protein